MPPTFETADRFDVDWTRLSWPLRQRFLVAKNHLVADLRAKAGFRPGLRVKRVQGQDGVWEMTFAPDGRATFEYGPQVHPGEAHLVWRRVGTHEVLAQP